MRGEYWRGIVGWIGGDFFNQRCHLIRRVDSVGLCILNLSK